MLTSTCTGTLSENLNDSRESGKHLLNTACLDGATVTSRPSAWLSEDAKVCRKAKNVPSEYSSPTWGVLRRLGNLDK